MAETLVHGAAVRRRLVVQALGQAQRRNDLLGGQASVRNTTPNAFSLPIPGLEREQELLFFVGNSFFNQNWVAAPASTTARDGLGPMFNARSCASCHFKDGRGRPPEFAGEAPTGFLVRLGMRERNLDWSNLPEPNYSGQFHDFALEGVADEGDFILHYEMLPGAYADGTPYELRKPTVELAQLNYGALHPEVMTSPRVGSQLIGLGLLESLPEARLLQLADPNDADGDGISGRPNYVWDHYNNRLALGRFGWKTISRIYCSKRRRLSMTTWASPPACSRMTIAAPRNWIVKARRMAARQKLMTTTC